MSEPETTIIAKERGISRIWIIPLIAALIGIWMIYQYLDEQGTTINISMPNADGITVGKTLIKTRSVTIGVVTDVRLAKNLRHVEIIAEIEKPYIGLLTSDALIWSVQPRIDNSGISGLSTILSGTYIELQPGASQSLAKKFVLLNDPPLVSQNVKGRRYQLYSKNAEVLSVGGPVIFKGFKVGSIEKAKFDWNTETMHYQIFIEEPNYNLVTENTLFWVESGIEFDLSADGISFKTGSLAKLLGGGITFGIPDREPKGIKANENHEFILSASFKDSLEERFDDFEYYVVTLDQSVRGLRPGAPVEYRGVRVGTVVEVPALLVQDGKPNFISNVRQEISVLIKIEFGRIFRNNKLAREFWTGNIEEWTRQGLRLSLQTGNLLTGGLFLEFEFFPDETPIAELEIIAGYKVLPGTSAGGLSQLSAQMSQFLKKLNSLELTQTLTSVDNTLGSYTQLAKEAEQLVTQTAASVDNTLGSYSQLAKEAEQLVTQTKSQNLPDELHRSLKELQTTLKDFQRDAPIFAEIKQSLDAIEKMGGDFQQGTPIYSDIRRTLRAIEQLSKELQPFSKSLNEHPSILIFDKSPQQDVQPKKGLSNE